MSQWKQIVFEGNQVTGISPISGGQSLGTGPGGGRAQHVYHARNRIQFVWGNDREIVTFDDVRMSQGLATPFTADTAVRRLHHRR